MDSRSKSGKADSRGLLFLFCNRDDSEYYGWPQFRPHGEHVMTLMNVNLWSVLVAGVSTMVVGFLWYSPMLFARPWMVAMGYDPEDKAKIQEMQKIAGKSYAISFIASLESAFVLGQILHLATANTALHGVNISF